MLHRWLAASFESLGLPAYRLLWGGSLFATLAFMMSFTVQPVVAFDLAGTNQAVGLVQMGLGISMLVIGPFGGVIADRVSKKPVVFAGQSFIAAAMLATGILLLADALTIGLLAATAAAMGLAFSFMGPARQAWVGEMVPPALLPNAVALSQLALSISRVAAPLIAGVLLTIAVIGAGGAYLIMASLFAVVLVATWLLPPTRPKPLAERRPIRAELREGIGYAAANPYLRLLLLFFAAVVVLGFTYQIVLPALLERHLDRPASNVGFLFTVNALGGLPVSLALAGLVGGRWAWPALFALPALMGVGLLVLAVAPSFEIAAVSMLLLGPGQWSFMLVNNALLMAHTAPAFYGRVMSLTMLAFGGQAILALPTGILADAVGEREVIAVAGVAALGVTALSALAFVPLRGSLPTRVAAASPSAGGAGPIVSTIEREQTLRPPR